MREVFLAHGVTSAVDLDSFFPWILEQRRVLLEGRMRGPRMFNTARSLSGRWLWDGRGRAQDLRPDLESAEMGRRLTRPLDPGREPFSLTKTATELPPGSGIALAIIPEGGRADQLRTFARLGISVDYPMFLMYHACMDMGRVDELVQLLVEEEVAVEFQQVKTGRGAGFRNTGRSGRRRTGGC